MNKLTTIAAMPRAGGAGMELKGEKNTRRRVIEAADRKLSGKTKWVYMRGSWNLLDEKKACIRLATRSEALYLNNRVQCHPDEQLYPPKDMIPKVKENSTGGGKPLNPEKGHKWYKSAKGWFLIEDGEFGRWATSNETMALNAGKHFATERLNKTFQTRFEWEVGKVSQNKWVYMCSGWNLLDEKGTFIRLATRDEALQLETYVG